MKTDKTKKEIIIGIFNDADWLNGSKIITKSVIEKHDLHYESDMPYMRKIFNQMGYRVNIGWAMYIRKQKETITFRDLQEIDNAKGI